MEWCQSTTARYSAESTDLRQVTGVPTPTSLECAETAKQLHDAGVLYTSGGDEHGVLSSVPPGMLPLGSQVQLIPAHCDPTVNLHDFILGVRDGAIAATFPVDARGPN